MPISIYGQILADILTKIPGAQGAILADWEGEAVDHAGSLQKTDIRLIGAHWGVIFALTREPFERRNLGAPVDVVLRFTNQQLVVRRLTEQYYVVISARPDVICSRIEHILDQAQASLLDQL